MLIDLHSHTIASYDGFTSESEMIEACLTRGINAIAITEHDKVSNLSPKKFLESNIELISGCEFTTDKGAHIIGLFVSEGLPFGSNRHEIIRHIKAQEGIVLMPHPWKKESGYMAIYEVDDLIYDFDFIEILNGGWNSKNYESEIISLSERYNLLMIASSDSHRGCQVGLCVTEIKLDKSFSIGDMKKILESLEQSNVKHFIDKKILAAKGRKTKKFQLNYFYQLLLPLIPWKLKRSIKILQYKLSNDSHASQPDFQIFTPEKI